MQSTMAARVVAFGLAAMTVGVRVASNFASAFNFNPVGALGIFGGSRLKSWQAYVLPIAVMIATDLILATFKGDEYGLLHPSRIWVYGCYLIYVLLGRFVVGDSKSPYRIGSATVLGAAQFFLITNFCEWIVRPEYTADIWGLLASYRNAIPFSLNTLAGDLIFTPLAFAAHAYLTRDAIVTEESLTAA
jgi:hypothetical protein